jgi:hypothetical protein
MCSKCRGSGGGFPIIAGVIAFLLGLDAAAHWFVEHQRTWEMRDGLLAGEVGARDILVGRSGESGQEGRRLDGRSLASGQAEPSEDGERRQGLLLSISGGEKKIVGIVEIAKPAYPDRTAEPDEPWVVVDTVAAEPLKTPVTLSTIKADAKLKEMALVKLSRLSVQPVTDAEWKHICKLGGVKG